MSDETDAGALSFANVVYAIVGQPRPFSAHTIELDWVYLSVHSATSRSSFTESEIVQLFSLKIGRWNSDSVERTILFVFEHENSAD